MVICLTLSLGPALHGLFLHKGQCGEAYGALLDCSAAIGSVATGQLLICLHGPAGLDCCGAMKEGAGCVHEAMEMSIQSQLPRIPWYEPIQSQHILASLSFIKWCCHTEGIWYTGI